MGWEFEYYRPVENTKATCKTCKKRPALENDMLCQRCLHAERLRQEEKYGENDHECGGCEAWDTECCGNCE